jgi:hypothetical protein
MNRLPKGAKPGERAIADRGRRLSMWTRTLLLIALFVVVLPLALLLGIHLGAAWVQQAVLP